MKRDFIYLAVIALLLIGIVNSCNKNNKEQASLTYAYNAANDTLATTRNKLGQEKASTALLYSTVKDFKSMHVADSSAIGKLQKIVDKLTISATFLSNSTGNNFSVKTNTVSSGDTVKIDSLIYVYPKYSTQYNNRWERLNLAANKDSFHVDYKVFNEFELKQSWERSHWWKRRVPVASILNLNPHTETVEYKTFTITENKRNRVRDFCIGVFAGLILTEVPNILVKFPIK